MAYSVKRRELVRETLKLKDEKGAVVRTLPIEVDVERTAKNVNQVYIGLVHACEKFRQQKKNGLSEETGVPEEAGEVYEEVGRAVYDLYRTVLGEENARTLLDFYEGRLIEMNLEVTPFVIQVMIPRIREAAVEMKKKAAARYGVGRKYREGKHGLSD